MSYISSATTVAYIDVRSNSKTVYLPPTFNIVGKLVTVKDIFGGSSSNIITLNTSGGDVFENGTTSYTLNQAYSAAGFVAQRGVWYLLNTNGGGSSTQGNVGISSLSSIVSYGLSSLRSDIGVSSLSSIISYGLSSLLFAVSGATQSISSLSSIISYGLSSINDRIANLDNTNLVNSISSLSSVVSYGLSTVYNDDKLRYNTYNNGFNLYNEGGTGIKDKSTGDPDTYTNGLAKIDDWIYKNIVDQPPALQSNTVAQTIFSVAFGWSNFFQFKIGILNLYAPFVSSLREFTLRWC